MRKITEERYHRLRTTGRVDIPQSPAYFLLMLLLALAFTVVGAAMIAEAFANADRWTGAFTVFEAWAGLAGVLFFGVLAIPVLLIQMRWRAELTLTPDGLAEHRIKKGERVTASTASWSEIEGFSAQYFGGRWPFKGQYTVLMHLRPDAHARYCGGLSPAMAGLQSFNEKLSGERTIALRRFAGGPKALHELLDQAHRQFGSDSSRSVLH